MVTEGHSSREYAKTAEQLLRYRPDDIVAVLDSRHTGSTASRLFGVGGDTPVIGDLAEADTPDSVFIGIAPPGGELPPGWARLLAEALERGLTLVSGLHGALRDHLDLAAAAKRSGARLADVRCSGAKTVATAVDATPECVRILTVGTDCSVGKMSAAKEIELELRRRGRDARFLATGQTGVMIGGVGLAIDAVVADFVNGAVEELVVDNEEHELVVIEGQGSIVHPAYSAVALGLLHGAAPDALVLCHELGRERLKSLPHVPVTPLAKLVQLHEDIGSSRRPCKVVGLALNGRRLDPAAATEQARRIELELGLPACDVYRDGPSRLVDALEGFDRLARERRGLVRKSTPAVQEVA